MSAPKPYYEHSGIVWYTAAHENMRVRVRLSCFWADALRSNSSIHHGAQPPRIKADEGTSRGDWRIAEARVADEAAASPRRHETNGSPRLRRGEGHCRFGCVAQGTHPRRRTDTWASASTRGVGAPHQRRPRGQQRVESVCLPRPGAPQRRAPVGGFSNATPAGARPDRLRGRSV